MKIYIFDLKFNAPHGLRVGGNKQEANVLSPIQIGDKYLIPSSSWKGVFRRVSEIVSQHKAHEYDEKEIDTKAPEYLNKYKEMIKTCDESVRCDEFAEVLLAKGIVEVENGEIKLNDQKGLVKLYGEWNCPLERLYGSEYFAGAITISDTLISSGLVERTHVVIDRKTRKNLVKNSKGFLYTEQIIDVNSVDVKVIIRTDRDDVVELWKKTLKFMSEVGTFIGGGKTRGIGFIKLDLKESRYAELRDLTASPIPKVLEEFVK